MTEVPDFKALNKYKIVYTNVSSIMKTVEKLGSTGSDDTDGDGSVTDNVNISDDINHVNDNEEYNSEFIDEQIFGLW